jgi:Protein of unknown function (DUF3429)
MPARTKSAAMPHEENRLVKVLPFLGMVPFLFGSAAVCLSFQLPFGLEPVAFLSSYGLVILGFMAGVHWGQHLSGIGSSLSLPLASNAFALAAWFGWLFLDPKWYFLLLAGLFMLLLAVDAGLRGSGTISTSYWRTRLQVTIIVTVALIAAAIGG